MWSNGNRFKVSSGDFIDIVKTVKPDLLVALSDGDAPKGKSQYRVAHVVKEKFLFDILLYIPLITEADVQLS